MSAIGPADVNDNGAEARPISKTSLPDEFIRRRVPLDNAPRGAAVDLPMIVGFLNGKQTPTVEQFGLGADPNYLAVSFRCFHDFGCALGDYRAFRKVTA